MRAMGQTGGQTDRRTNEQTDGRTDRQSDGRTDSRTDRQTDGRTDSRTDGQTERQTDRHDEANSRFRNFTKVPKKQEFEREFAEPSVWCRLPLTQEQKM